jgi:hypothetical protein
VGDVLRSAGYAGLGDYTDDIADGGAFIFDMVEAIGDNPAAAAGPAAQNAAAGFVIAGGMTALSATGPVGATVVAVSVVGMSIYTIWYVHELALRWDQMSPESQAEAAGGFFGGLAGAVAGGSVQGSLRSRPSTPGPTRPATQYVTMPRIARHGELSRELRGTGSQSNHLSQDASYRNAIPTKDGLATPMRGDAIREPGTPHFEFHRALEKFWEPYRSGELKGRRPTNGQYLVALYTALRSIGYSEMAARVLTEAAAAQQQAHGLTSEMPVPRLPSRMPQRQ